MYKTFKEITERVINEFIVFYCQNPMNFLYEADIQGMLFTRLFDEFAKSSVRLATWKDKEKQWNRFVGNHHSTNPVKTEYPCNTRFDIGILNPEYEESPILNSYNLPVEIGIEIKHCQFENKLEDILGLKKSIYPSTEFSLNRDLHELKTYSMNNYNKTSRSFCGCGLLFVQNYDYKNNKRPNDKEDIIEYLERLFHIQKKENISIEPGIYGCIIFSDKSIYRYDYK